MKIKEADVKSTTTCLGDICPGTVFSFARRDAVKGMFIVGKLRSTLDFYESGVRTITRRGFIQLETGEMFRCEDNDRRPVNVIDIVGVVA